MLGAALEPATIASRARNSHVPPEIIFLKSKVLKFDFLKIGGGVLVMGVSA